MSTEMKKLIIGGTEYEIVDDAGRARITALEQGGGGSGTGLTQTEKNLLLSLFEKAAYAEDDAGTAYTALSNLWTGYSITWSGTGYTKSNSAIAVSAGASFTSTITANTGFTITDVVATMGGNTVQGAWSSGTITIPNVTGDIVITVTTSQMTVSSISAVYTQSGTVYDTDSLDSLKSDLVVTATFMDSTTGVIAAEDYTLSGTLAVGTSTITVSYAGLTDTFSVTVSHAVQDTTANVIRTDKVLAHMTTEPYYADFNQTNGGITQIYTMTAPTTVLYPAGIIPTSGNVLKSAPAALYVLDDNNTPINFVSEASGSSFNRWGQDASGTMTEFKQTWNVAEYSKIQFSVDIRYLDDAYMYDYTTGQVWFAGKNTPYYGMTNISEASA